MWNLIGNGAPILVAVFSIPILIGGLGKDRFRCACIGVGDDWLRQPIRPGTGSRVDATGGEKNSGRVRRSRKYHLWCGTSLLLMLLLGLTGTLCVAMASPWLVRHVLNVPTALQRETLGAFYLLALSIPLVITTAGLRGLLEAHQRFALINVLRIPMGVFTFAGPLLVLPFSKNLFPIVAVLLGGRLMAWAAHLGICLRILPELRHGISWHHAAVGPLLRFGGWDDH